MDPLVLKVTYLREGESVYSLEIYEWDFEARPDRADAASWHPDSTEAEYKAGEADILGFADYREETLPTE